MCAEVGRRCAHALPEHPPTMRGILAELLKSLDVELGRSPALCMAAPPSAQQFIYD